MLKRGTRIRIKHAAELGLKPSAYAFEAHQGAYFFIDSKGGMPNCWSVCPENELDGRNDAIRMFNEKRKYHLTIPEHCFVVEPVTKIATKSQRTKLLGALKPFMDIDDKDLDGILQTLAVTKGLDLDRVMVLLELSHRNPRMLKQEL